MKKLFVLTAIFFLLSAFALGFSMDTLKYLNVETCEEFATQLDIVGEELPDGVPFQNELVNLKINELNLTSNIQVQRGHIVGVFCGESNESTYDLTMDNLSTINDIILDEDPLDAYLDLKETGAITITTTSFGKQLKLFFGNIIATVLNWFV